MSIHDLLNQNFVAWMDAEKGPASDIVISSRVRLARNLRLVPFPHLLDEKRGNQVVEEIRKAWKKSGYHELLAMDLVTFNELPLLDRKILMEKHLISPEHSEASASFKGIMVNKDGSLAFMINEEDHLRLQCFLPGLQLMECYNRLQGVDDELEKYLDYAFDEKRGYLTSCPTNVGTGMRASVMLHLPALAISGQLNRIFQNVNQLGMTVRGLYGENTDAVGNFYQLSNQITLGQTEEDIINNLTGITEQIVEQERLTRERLLKEMPYQIEDRIGRAYGILTNARVMTSNEAMLHLSDVRLGVDLGIIKGLKPFALNELIVALRPAHLQKKAGKEMEPFERDVKRAEVIKEKLARYQK
ncbi:protein arginine kinase [Thermosyntropha lipolytica DSM 11003]|uniref:Protein-arginine kinase n=1 Tax=Thermosyntropha lipolytica DSM 11003 TaxID=1123382 RepID=A0A1M5NSG1_9FIRM|nr:protein arginine kinase [Thermosyntropha lipolytica]SHG92398.1 protein arginine kinase [Thermosyntropha lipolytica DSM 11003]